jgi:two-component system, OmpR family, heavy metal sensor histidine kinase CusS
MSLKHADPAPAAGQAAAPVKRPRSLAARLTAWYALSVFVIVTAAGGLLYFGLEKSLLDDEDAYLNLRIQVIRSILRDRPEDSAGLKWVVESKPLGLHSARNLARVLDIAGNEVAEAPGMDDFLPSEAFPRPTPLGQEPTSGTDVLFANGKTFRVMSAFAQLGSSGAARIIEVSVDRTRDQEVLAKFRREFLFVLAGTLILSVFGGQFIARRGTRSVKAMGETASRIRNTNLRERVDTTGLPSELVKMAVPFNTMLDHLEESFARLSQFSEDLAHELRTPLNNLRGEAEVALSQDRSGQEYREVLESSLEEFNRLSRIIDSLLFLARAESPESQMEKSVVNAKEELEKICEFYRAAAGEKGVALSVRCDEALFVNVNLALFQRAIGNLIENSLAHTPPSGTVRFEASLDGAQVRFDVVDTGSGIAREDLPHVFERFYRSGDSKGQNGPRVGLGLAIVKSAATMHGGTVDIASEFGKGTRVSLRLPAAHRA